MITVDYLTKHERGALVAALRDYETRQSGKKRKMADARDRAIAGANAYVASDLLRVLAER